MRKYYYHNYAFSHPRGFANVYLATRRKISTMTEITIAKDDIIAKGGCWKRSDLVLVGVSFLGRMTAEEFGSKQEDKQEQKWFWVSMDSEEQHHEYTKRPIFRDKYSWGNDVGSECRPVDSSLYDLGNDWTESVHAIDADGNIKRVEA